jgi:O-antigen/teichoic acid export membrane protein
MAIDLIKYFTANNIHINAVIKGAASVMAVRVVGAGIAYSLQVLLAQWLGASEYGIFAYAWVWMTILGYLATLGMNASVVRFIPDYLSRKRWWRVKGLVYRSRRIVLFAALGFTAIGVLGVFLARELIPAYYIHPLYIAFSCVPLFALTNLYEGMARSFGWVNLAYIPTYIVRPAVFVAAMAVLFYSGVALNGTIALILALISFVLILFGQTLLFGRYLPAKVQTARPTYHSLHWLRGSFPFMLILTFQIILTNTDMIMLGGFVEPDQVAIYFASVRTANLVLFVSFAVSALAVPKFAALHANGEKAELQRLVTGIVQWIFWPSLVLVIVLLIFGRPILSLFGPVFSDGYFVLALLMLAHLVRAATGPIDHLLNMTGNQGATAWALACSGIINIFLNALLIPYFGFIGAAIATTVSIVISTVWLLILVKYRLGINAWIFSRSKPVAAAASGVNRS